jgi:hypothetical protein
MLNTDKKAAAVQDKQVEGGAKCIFPKDVEVAELHKGREFYIQFPSDIPDYTSSPSLSLTTPLPLLSP